MAIACAVPAAHAQKKYDAGATDSEIKVGQTVPLSGPASAYSSIAKTQAAYMRMVNEQGGVNGRKINLIQYDDAYSPPKTVEQVRRLVEGDEVLLTFQIIGTAPNAAVQKYLNAKKVPQLFAATGAARFTDPKNFPWTMGFNPSYFVEGRIYGQFILKEHPNAKVGVLYQNDDLGKDYLAGIKAGLGDKAAKMIVAEASYELSEPTIDSQILKIRDCRRRPAVQRRDAEAGRAGDQEAVRDRLAPGAHHRHQRRLDRRGAEAGRARSLQGRDQRRLRQGAGRPAMGERSGQQRYLDFMAKYYPDGDRNSSFNVYGYITAQLLVQVLKQCGDDLTRDNVMRQASNLTNVPLDMLLPGISVTTTPTDYRVNKQFQMAKFDGEKWERFGDIITDQTKE